MSDLPAPFPITPDWVRLVGGGYLRNTIRESRVTCEVCTTPVAGYARCYKCYSYPHDAGPALLATQVVTLVYAVNNGQSGHLMRTYKRTDLDVDPLLAQVTVLVAYALQEHRRCMEGTAVGWQPLGAWTSVPSTRNRHGAHPIAVATRDGGFAPGHRVDLLPGPDHDAPGHRLAVRRWVVDDPRAVEGRHVLVVDDTWTSGANSQSAAAAIHAAGATAVTVLVVARWIKDDPYCHDFVESRLRGAAAVDYSPRTCPVTGGDCPG